MWRFTAMNYLCRDMEALKDTSRPTDRIRQDVNRSPGGDSLGSGDAPSIFYSRRIGLAGSRAVPVIAGARLSGKAGAWTIGGLTMQTDDDEVSGAEQTNFSVLRVRRDILRRSTIGAIITERSVSTISTGSNYVAGVDANFAFFQNIFLNGYVAKSQTDGMSGHDLNYRTHAPFALSDLTISRVRRPLRGSSNGRAEACLWLGSPGSAKRVSVRRCGITGIWTGTATRGSNDDGASGSTASGSMVRSRTSSFSPRNMARMRCEGSFGYGSAKSK